MDNWVIWFSLVVNLLTLWLILGLWAYFKEYIDTYTKYVRQLEEFTRNFIIYVNTQMEQAEEDQTEENKNNDNTI